MSLYRPIPQLKLAANVEQALSPWALRDYGKLLYWIFFFPQALRDYFATDNARERQNTLLGMSTLLLLVVMAVVVAVTGLSQVQLVDLPFSAAQGSALGGAPLGLLMGGLVYLWNRWKKQPAQSVALGFTTGLATTILSMFSLGELFDDTFMGMASTLGYGFVGGSAMGIIGNLANTLDSKLKVTALQPALSAGIGGLLILLINSVNYSDSFFNLNLSQENLLAAVSGALTYYGGAQLGLRRPLDWLLSKLTLNWQLRTVATSPESRQFMRDTNPITDFAPGLEALFAPTAPGHLAVQLGLPHVTRYAIPQLGRHLDTWLEVDWEKGIDNAYQLWRYTNQQPLVTQNMHQVLAAKKTDQQVAQVTKLVDKLDGEAWPLIAYPPPRPVATERGKRVQPPDKATVIQTQRRWFLRQQMRWSLAEQKVDAPANLRLETPAQQTVAALWHLKHIFMEESLAALQKLPDDALSKELVGIAQSIEKLLHTHNLAMSPTVELPERPKEPKRKATWDALEKFKPVVRYGWLYHQCKDEKRREAVVGVATHQLDDIIKDAAKIPPLEREMICKLVELWRKEFEQWTGSTRGWQNMKPINPFIFLEPLRERKPFVGRDDALKALKQAGTRGSRQSVLLYGLPHSGKSALIIKAMFEYNDDICFVLFNIPNTGNETLSPKQVYKVMHQSLQRRLQLKLTDEELANFQTDPATATEKLIRDICYRFKTTLVLVVGNVDQLMVTSGQATVQGKVFANRVAIADSVFGYWWQLAESIGNLSFVFVSHAADLPGTPFTPSLKKIQIRNLEIKDVLKLLTTPTAEFTPLFAPEAVEYIYTLTGGQPFLVQLLAHCVTDRFNQTLDKDDKLPPVFLIEDVDSILTGEAFRQFSRPYFTNLCRQLEVLQPGSTAVLHTIAQYADGITADELEQVPVGSLAWPQVEVVLGFLESQQVIKLVEGRYQVVGELLRQAV